MSPLEFSFADFAFSRYLQMKIPLLGAALEIKIRFSLDWTIKQIFYPSPLNFSTFADVEYVQEVKKKLFKQKILPKQKYGLPIRLYTYVGYSNAHAFNIPYYTNYTIILV